MRGCAFCDRLEEIYELPEDRQEAARDALFDLAGRAKRARTMYGRRKGYHR